jgi:predicted transcriptional regulator containing an HTH domain and an uncharacterized domain shared with the mammalian protein schlafen
VSDINDVKKNLKVIIEELISHDSEEEWFEFKENWYEPVDAQVKYKNAQVNAQVKVNQVLDETQNYDVSIEEKALQFCSEAKSIIEICDYLGFKDRRTVRKIINPLLELGRLAMTVPDKPNSRNQKYIAIK